MSESEDRRHRIHVGGDVSGQFVIGDHNTTIQGAADTVNIAELVRFAEAVADALPSLAPDRRESAQALAAEIIGEAGGPAPDHGRLRRLGQSLRAIVEGGAGNALATAMLSLWTP